MEREKEREIDLINNEHILQESCALSYFTEPSFSLAVTLLLEHHLSEGELAPVNRWDNSDLEMEPKPGATSECCARHLLPAQ